MLLQSVTDVSSMQDLCVHALCVSADVETPLVSSCKRTRIKGAPVVHDSHATVHRCVLFDLLHHFVIGTDAHLRVRQDPLDCQHPP